MAVKWLRCLTLINNRKSIFQQLAVNGNLSSFHELTMHSSAQTRPTATANYRLAGGFTNRALSLLASPLSFLLWQFFLTLLSSLILLQVFWFCLVKEKLLSPTLTSSHFKYIYIYISCIDLHWVVSACHNTCRLCLYRRQWADVQARWEMIIKKD